MESTPRREPGSTYFRRDSSRDATTTIVAVVSLAGVVLVGLFGPSLFGRPPSVWFVVPGFASLVLGVAGLTRGRFRRRTNAAAIVLLIVSVLAFGLSVEVQTLKWACVCGAVPLPMIGLISFPGARIAPFAVVTWLGQVAIVRSVRVDPLELIFCAAVLLLVTGATTAFPATLLLRSEKSRAQSEALQRAAQHVATHDALTGLLNRRGLRSALASCWDSSDPDAATTVLLIDVDHFKRVNDSRGHDAGDAVLVLLAGVLRDVFGDDGALCSRWGGEEFVVVLRYGTTATGLLAGERLRQEVEVRSRMDPGGIPVTVSVGVAAATSSSGAAGELDREALTFALVSQADTFLYEAKSSGRNRVVGGLVYPRVGQSGQCGEDAPVGVVPHVT